MIIYLLAAGVCGLNAFLLYMLYYYLGIPNMFSHPITLISIGMIVSAVVSTSVFSGSNNYETEEQMDVDTLLQQLSNQTPASSNVQPTTAKPSPQPKTTYMYSDNPLVDALTHAIREARFEVEGGLRLEINKTSMRLGEGVSADLYGNLLFESKRKRENTESIKPETQPTVQSQNMPDVSVPLDAFLKRKIAELESED